MIKKKYYHLTRISSFFTGPLTLRIIDRLGSSKNSTRTWVTLPIQVEKECKLLYKSKKNVNFYTNPTTLKSPPISHNKLLSFSSAIPVFPVLPKTFVTLAS